MISEPPILFYIPWDTVEKTPRYTRLDRFARWCDENIKEVLFFISLGISGICILIVMPLYIFSAAFLFTENNYKFTVCCSHEKFDFDRASREDLSLLLLIVFFYIFEFIFCAMATMFVYSGISFLFFIRIIIVGVLHIIACVWLSVKVNFISIFYIVTTIINFIIGVVYFIIYRFQCKKERLEEEET